MKITKEDGENKISIYQPDKEEEEKLFKISDEIIDLITSHNLTDDQQIHLVSSLYETMKEIFGIKEMRHGKR